MKWAKAFVVYSVWSVCLALVANAFGQATDEKSLTNEAVRRQELNDLDRDDQSAGEKDSKSNNDETEQSKKPPSSSTSSRMKIADLSETNLLVVVGVPGEETYFEQFNVALSSWQSFAERAGCELIVFGRDLENKGGNRAQPAAAGAEATSDRELLLEKLADLHDSKDPLWIVFVGHGTFDGTVAKFNLRGRDVTAAEVENAIRKRTALTVIVNCASASGPFVNRLSAENRVVVAATKSGSQYNATRFGQLFAAAVANPKNDLDKDGQISLLETFIAASSTTQEFYATQDRIATETAILDDNGDKKGTPADWFSGVRSIKKAKNTSKVDGVFANEIFIARSDSLVELTDSEQNKRTELEAALEQLIAKRKQYSEEDFLREVEPILLQLAKLYSSKTMSK